MKLSADDMKLLKSWGYPESDFRQIQEAMGRKTKLTLSHRQKKVPNRKISHKEARQLLGDEDYLSGISRSAFHWTSLREVDEQYFVFFDSSALFKD